MPGMVQIDSLNIDTAESIRRAVEFQARVPALVAAEAAYLREQRRATSSSATFRRSPSRRPHAAGIPSVAIGNFTWDWIYEGYRDEAARELAREIRRLYRHATIALRLPMAGGFEGWSRSRATSRSSRAARDATQDDVRGALGLPPRADGKPLVLMSFGGYGVAGLDTPRSAP